MKLPSSSFLILGFIVGQGSLFCLQLYFLALNRDSDAGFIYALITLYSFSAQFSELGNTVRYSQINAKGDVREKENFYFGRWAIALIAGVLTTLWYILISKSQDFPIEVMPFLIGCAAMIFAVNGNAENESAGKYGKYVLIQSGGWVLFCVLIVLSYSVLGENSYKKFALYLPLLIAILVWYANPTPNSIHKNKITIGILFAGVMSIFPYLFGQVFAQVWGRLMIANIHSDFGLEELGKFGIVRQVQLSLILLIGFLIRPHVRKYVSDVGCNEKPHTLRCLLVDCRNYLILSLLLSLLALLIYGLNGMLGVLGKYREWMPLLMGTFPTVLGIVLLQYIHSLGIGRHVLILEIVALSLNMMVFLSLISEYKAYAILMSEAALLIVCVLYLTIYKPPKKQVSL